MTDFEKLELAYKYCNPLKVECIKKELESQLEGYSFKSIEREPGEWTVCFENLNGERIILTILLNYFSIIKITATRVETLTGGEKRLLTHSVDRRQNGVVYSIIQKKFGPSSRFNQIVLTDLVEQRFTFTRDKINSLFKNVDFDNARLVRLILKLKVLESRVDLKSESNFYSEFSTHMNYYFNWSGGRKIRDNIYPTRTYLNDEEVSGIFDVDGPDKIYRIYDLYNGIINPRNEKDINYINLGLLSQDAFNFKELKGINERENVLVGTPLVNANDTYVNYLKKFFEQRFGYKGDIKLDRDSMLLGITYHMSKPESTKRKIESKLGTTDNKFEQLDFDEQQKLKKRNTDKLTNGPKRLLKRLLKPFNKK